MITPSDDEMLKRITDAAYGIEANFACGGSVTCTQPVQIVFKEPDSTNKKAGPLRLSSTLALMLSVKHGLRVIAVWLATAFNINKGAFLKVLELPSLYQGAFLQVLELPSQGADEAALKALTMACSAATFGLRVPSTGNHTTHMGRFGYAWLLYARALDDQCLESLQPGNAHGFAPFLNHLAAGNRH